MNDKFKSILSVVAGIVVGAVLSVATDSLLEIANILQTDPFDSNPTWMIAIVVTYRTVFNATGAYVTARLAPARPMKHVIILGLIGLLAGIAGAAAMWHIPPHWYPVSLVVLTMPAVWMGGSLALKKSSIQN